MVRILLSFAFAAALAACTPSPQETAMHSPSPDPGTPAQGSSEGGSDGQAPLSVADNPLPAVRADSPAEAEGRRILSTAFVRVGPDGRLVVELRDGRALLLRDVVMRARDYCGVQLVGGKAGGQYCGGYADVAAARPGAPPSPQQPDPASSPVKSPRK